MKKEIIDNCILYLGDCREILESLEYPIGACVTDPPYGLGKKLSGTCLSKSIEKQEREKQRKKAMNVWDVKAPCLNFIQDLKVPSIIFGGNYFVLPPSRMWLIWDKGGSMRGRTYAEGEMAHCNFDGNLRIKTYNPLSMSEDKVHFTQKPIDIMKWVISHLPPLSKETYILDPFMGPGTTLIAGADLGYKVIGIEIDPEYFDSACKRVENFHKQLRMF